MVAGRESSALKWLFRGAILALALYLFSENTADPDLWAHTLVGEHLLRTGHLQNAEPYSWTARGTPWINHELLAELALGAVHWVAGGTGILLLKMAIGFLTFGIALILGADDLPWPRRAAAWGVGALAAVEISYGFAPRPQIFTALGLAIELWVLRQVARGKTRWGWVLPVLFVLWVNTHGGVLAGLAVLIAAAAAGTTQFLWPRFPSLAARIPVEPFSKQSVATLWILCPVCACALLANPYGWALIRWTINGVVWLNQRTELEEWLPATLSWDHAALFVLAFVTITALAFSRRRRVLWEMAVCAGMAAFAFRSVRHTPLFAIAALAFVPPHLADVIVRLREHYAGLEDCMRRRGAQWAIAVLLAFVTVGECAGTFVLHKEHPLTMEVPKSQYPLSAISFIRSHELHGNLLVFFDWGEQCLWELPECAVSLDGRWETCYPRDLIPEHWKFYNGEPVDRKILDIEKADLALLPANLAGVPVLARQPGWQVAYFDRLAVVLVRDPRRFPKLASAKLPVEGPPDAALGRAPFPNAKAARVAQ
ncbi:MAG TPA: hypothetical protein VGO59_19750 [Verrucomicrobiae bacterium]|jgi:hypothetical protein